MRVPCARERGVLAVGRWWQRHALLQNGDSVKHVGWTSRPCECLVIHVGAGLVRPRRSGAANELTQYRFRPYNDTSSSAWLTTRDIVADVAPTIAQVPPSVFSLFVDCCIGCPTCASFAAPSPCFLLLCSSFCRPPPPTRPPPRPAFPAASGVHARVMCVCVVRRPVGAPCLGPATKHCAQRRTPRVTDVWSCILCVTPCSSGPG